MTGILVRHAEVDGRLVDVRIRAGTIVEIGAGLDDAGTDEILDALGAALIPGLHDHHVHLLATAAADASVQLGPPDVRDATQFTAALRRAAQTSPPGAWVRGVGYHESVAGEVDRAILDAIVPDRCVRIQHRSGALWMMNTRGLRALRLDSPTGRLYGSDELLRDRLGDGGPPSLTALGMRLASYGVTGVTDATPSSDLTSIELLAHAVAERALPQAVVVMGGVALADASSFEHVRWGPVKFVIADHALPSLDQVRVAIETAHQHGRPVAIHCVTAVALALALAAWLDVGARDGDRIEHGAVVTPEAAARIAELGLTVVTQPGFISTRGDQYRKDVAPDDLPHLYPCGSLLKHGVKVGGSTDAPFGNADPWSAIKAAVERRTESGVALGRAERVSSHRALDLFLTPADDPGGRPREVRRGAAADLCLLDAPLRDALATPSHHHVAVTIIAGRVAYRR